MSSYKPQIALLFDPENFSSKHADEVFRRLAPHGEIALRIACGKKESLRSWQKPIAKYKLTPIEVPAGANNADKIIHSRSIEITVYQPEIDTFCLVSNDGGFAKTYRELKGYGKKVIGIGMDENHASKKLKENCDQFITISDASIEPIKGVSQKPTIQPLHEFQILLGKAFAESNGKWVRLSALGQSLRQIEPTFKPNRYGSASLSKLLKKHPKSVEVKQNMARIIQ